MKTLLVALAALACACADLTPVAQGTCGNGVLDPGEDCDLPDQAVCSQCSYTCGNCPAGYVCSARDQLCHAPTGVFSRDPTGQFSFPAVTGYVADINADQIPDLIGLSGSSLTATYGQAQGDLTAQATQVTPTLAGPGAFAVRPLAGGGDQLLLGTEDGIAGYRPESGKLLPYPFSNPLAQAYAPCTFMHQSGVTAMTTFAYDGKHVNGVARDAAGNVWLVVIEVPSGLCGYAPACGMKAGPDDKVYVDRFDTTSVTGTTSELVAIGLAPTTPPPQGATTLCVLRHDATASPPAPPGQVPGAPIDNHGASVTFAHLSAAACPWLVTAGDQLTALAPGSDASGCTLTGSPVTFQADPSDPAAALLQGNGAPVGRVPLDPPVGQLEPDAIAVTTWPPSVFGQTVVLGIHPPGAGNVASADDLYASSSPLFAVRSARDASGRVRTVGTSAFDVEVLERLGMTPYFSAYRIPSAGSPTALELLDLDADGRVDIAYTEEAGDGERLEIAWGGAGLPEPPQEYAAGLPSVLGLFRVDIPDSSDPNDVIPDLALVHADPAGDPAALRLVVFHGGPQRTLPAYFDPRTPTAIPSAFSTLLAGSFLGPTAGTDVITLEVPQSGNARLWEFPGSPDGSLATAMGPYATDAGACSGTASLCADSALFTNWPVAASDGTTSDVAIGVDPRGRVAMLDPRTHTTMLASCAPGACQLPDAEAGSPWQLHGVFAGDPGPGRQLFVIYAPPDIRDATGMVMACQVSDQGVPSSCTQLTYDVLANTPGVVDGLGNQLCTDAITGPFSPPPATRPEVLLVCRPDQGSNAALWKLSADGSSYHATQVRGLGNTRFVVFADVTGDGLPDLIAISLDSSTPLVDIYPQCDHRDLACVKAGAP